MKDPARFFLILGCFFAFLGVVLGAFAAHVLKTRLTPEMLNIFEVAVRYHIYHAFALFVVAWASVQWPMVRFTVPGLLFVAGIGIFSGSLYALSLTGIRALGAITPIGGLSFLLGWFLLAFKVWRIS